MTYSPPARPTITAATQRILRAHTGADLTLTFLESAHPDDWGRNLVWRYHVENAPPDCPPTVIAKISKLGGGHIFPEWTSLAFLNSFTELHDLVPTFFGGDRDLELLVMEDLGSVFGHHDLGSILFGDDPDLARHALLAHARAMARLHSATSGHEAAYDRLRATLPTYDQPISKDLFEANFAWFLGLLPQLDIVADPGLPAEVETIIAHLRHPDAPRAYNRGDVCPSNVLYRDGRLRLYDFEMGAFRNIFLSAVTFQLAHVTCFHGNLLPAPLRAEAEAAYFEALTPLIPNPVRYQTHYAAAAAAMLIWIFSLTFENDDRPRGGASTHQRLFATLSLFLDNPTFAIPFPHLTQALRHLHHHLKEQWPSHVQTIPPYPAFESP